MEKVVQVEKIDTQPKPPLTPSVEASGSPPENLNQEKPVVRSLDGDRKNMKIIYIAIAIASIFAGIGTGYALANGSRGGQSAVSSGAGEVKNEAGELGVVNEEVFKDEAEGILREGGIDGEGTHHLDRGMGAEKDVYLTSTIIDLRSFVGKKVKVWGETISGKKAGWLMDVGRIKEIE